MLQYLLALKTNKAIGLDKTRARLLKNSVHTIALSVTKLLNLLIKTGKFPKLWKCSKTGQMLQTTDLSLFCLHSARFLRKLYVQLYQFLVANKLLSGKQFGFRKGLSTISALTSFADEVFLNMEHGRLCGAMFLDLTKAFDMTVDH